ncbi:MAG: hypothetical protein ACR2LN_01670 [Candidatus Levyibacteriota bacterium]
MILIIPDSMRGPGKQVSPDNQPARKPDSAHLADGERRRTKTSQTQSSGGRVERPR